MKLSVVIGRFQNSYLHSGHCKVIDAARDNGDILVVLIGKSHLKSTELNPLTFRQREYMIKHHYPSAVVVGIGNTRTNSEWSERVDTIVGIFAGLEDEVMLYGGRDSFIPSYTGTYDTFEVAEVPIVSGTMLRGRA